MSNADNQFYAFGPFRLDSSSRVLHRGGELVALPPKAADLLLVLVEAAGTVVSKDDLMRRVWPNTFVEEGNLPVNVFALRKALGDDGEQYIRTVPKRGYCFVAPVNREAGVASERRATDQASAIETLEGPSAPAQPPLAARPEPARRESRWRLALAIAIVLAVGFGSLSYVRTTRHGRVAIPGKVQTLAVLPFSSAGADTIDEATRAGMSAEVIGRLSSLRQVAVRPLASAWKFAGDAQDPIEAGRALQVDAVLRGTMRTADDIVHVSARLVRVADGSVLWDSAWAEPADALSSLTSDLAIGVGRALDATLGAADQLRLRRPAQNAEAYWAYLSARGLAHQMTAREVTAGIDRFQAAVAAEPGFADAQSGLSAFLALPLNSSPPRETLQQAKLAAGRALALNPDLAEAHSALGRALNLGDWNWEGAATEYRRAIALAPNMAEAHFWYGVHLSATGRHDDALAELRLAQALDPTSPRVNLNLGMTLLMARRYAEAVAQFRKTPLEMGPVAQQVYLALVVALAKQGHFDQALSVLERVATRTGGTPLSKAHAAYVYAEAGRGAEARPLLAEFEAAPEEGRTPYTIVAAAYACAGDMERAFMWIDRAEAHRDVRLAYLKVDPLFDCARGDRRYAERLRRIGLTP